MLFVVWYEFLEVSSRFLSFYSYTRRLYKHVVIWGKQNSEMSWPNSLETVFVIDHGPVMARPSDIEFDVFNKTRSHGAEAFIPVTSLCKSLWTCAAEPSFEYCRIVWDICHTGRLVRCMISDVKAHPVGSWATNQQNPNAVCHYSFVLKISITTSLVYLLFRSPTTTLNLGYLLLMLTMGIYR